mgnify:CR=1 FL=1
MQTEEIRFWCENSDDETFLNYFQTLVETHNDTQCDSKSFSKRFFIYARQNIVFLIRFSTVSKFGELVDWLHKGVHFAKCDSSVPNPPLLPPPKARSKAQDFGDNNEWP